MTSCAEMLAMFVGDACISLFCATFVLLRLLCLLSMLHGVCAAVLCVLSLCIMLRESIILFKRATLPCIASCAWPHKMQGLKKKCMSLSTLFLQPLCLVCIPHNPAHHSNSLTSTLDLVCMALNLITHVPC